MCQESDKSEGSTSSHPKADALQSGNGGEAEVKPPKTFGELLDELSPAEQAIVKGWIDGF
jgi:hypothetical protein